MATLGVGTNLNQDNTGTIPNQNISQLGYNLGLGGMGISLPAGTAYNAYQTPAAVYGGYNAPGFKPGDTTINQSKVPTYNTPQQSSPAPTPTPQQSGSGSGGGINKGNLMSQMPGYAGWDPNAAWDDYLKTGGAGKGGNQGGDAYSNAINMGRSAVNSAYDPIFSQLDSMAGLIPNQQQTRETKLGDLYGSQLNELQGSRQNAIAGLDTSKEQVAQRQAQSIRDLQQNMTQMARAGNMQLGSAGAGDSSAARMYGFALSKAAGQGSADIGNQAQSMYTQIDQQANQIKSTFDDNMNKLNTWKNEQSLAITDWAQNQLNQIQQAKLSATGQKATALAANETGIINNALSALQQIDSQIASWNQGLQSWALNRMASIDDAKAKISGYGNYTPGQITQREMQGLGNFSNVANGAMSGYNPYSSKKDELNNFFK